MKIFILLFIVMASGVIYSQGQDRGVLKGIIVDSETSAPLPFSNITIHNINDSSYINGTASGTDGEFLLADISRGKYLVKISYMGYKNKFMTDVEINSRKDIGVVKLEKAPVELSEANVTGARASEELHLDKKVINVSQNTNAAGGTALDVLQDQPSVRVDPDGSVYLRGSSNFTVLINGKPGVLQGSDALRQISANMIENIELITNPSAKYDAEGSAGIININLKKQSEYSISGIANVSSGTRDKYNSDFTMNYNLNGMNITAGVDYRDNTFINNQDIDRVAFAPSGNITNSTDLFIRNKQRQFSGRAGIDYTFNNKNSLAFTFSGGNMKIKRSLSAEVQNEDPLISTYANIITNAELPIDFINTSFNYSHKFDPEVNDIMFEATYANVNLPSDQLSNEYITDNEFLNSQPEPKRTFFGNDAVRKEGRVKLNYTHKINPNSTFETGVQSNINYRTFDIQNLFYDWNAGDYIVDDVLTNNFKMWNNVHSGFTTYSNKLFDFDFMLGLRAEYTDRLLEQKTLGNDYEYNKLDYFPSLNISRKIEDHQFQFSYSRRINRPNENLLNPFPFYSDSYLTTSGNPELLPEYINSFELNYQKVFGTVFSSVQTYYRSSTNSMLQQFKVDDNGKMNVKFGNFAETKTYGSEISASLPLFEIFRFDPAVNLFGTDLNGDVDGFVVERSFFNWSARMNATVTITPDTRFQLSGNYFAKFVNAQSESESFLIMNASLKQDFWEKKFSLTLQARNFLKTGYINIANTGTNYISSVQVRPEIPVINLMLTYNFNNFKKPVKPVETIDIPTGL
jgi:outer membrane receptor protein involved in Fe transport